MIFLVVATLDEQAFRARFETRARSASQRPEHRYLEHFDAILRIQDHFLELADRHDIPIVDNDSIDGSVLSIIKHVTETLRKSRLLRRRGDACVIPPRWRAGSCSASLPCGTLSVSDEQQLGDEVRAGDPARVPVPERRRRDGLRHEDRRPTCCARWDRSRSSTASTSSRTRRSTRSRRRRGTSTSTPERSCACATSRELAGVIAHEIGHVTHRHIAQNYETAARGERRAPGRGDRRRDPRRRRRARAPPTSRPAAASRRS